jgi:hypothetical protein
MLRYLVLSCSSAKTIQSILDQPFLLKLLAVHLSILATTWLNLVVIRSCFKLQMDKFYLDVIQETFPWTDMKRVFLAFC